jgi:hypothetical protein
MPARSETIRRARFLPLAIAALALSSLPLLGQEISRERTAERVRDINRRLKREGAGWRAGNVSPVYPTPEQSRLLFPPIPHLSEEARATLPVIRAAGTETFPLVWDWREMNGVTPVKHQFRPHGCDTCYEYCGSCYAFAACAQLESFIKIYDGREEDLSEQQILSCRSEPKAPGGPGGCYGGDATLAYNDFLDPGAVAETCMVYEADHTIPCADHGCAVHGRISGYSIVEADESSLKLALMSGPVWIDMYSCDDFKYFYTGGSYTYPPGVAGVPNHAMLCVGWNDTLSVCDSTGCETIGSWIVKNSWGASWGYAGYGYIRYGTPSFAEDAFQIHYTPGPVSQLFVQAPDGGQVWGAGSRHKILWRSTGLAVDHFELGRISGGDYRLIDGAVAPDAREYLWTPDAAAIGDCIVTVRARGPADELLGSDSGDGPLSVLEPRTAWDARGLRVCQGDASQLAPLIACDHLGGSIVLWRDARYGNPAIFAQRFDGAGNAIWNPSGVCLTAWSDFRSGVRAAYDGAGGVFAVWENTRQVPGETGTDIHAQHVGSNGAPLPHEIVISSPAGTQQKPQIVADGAGGAYVVWEDASSGGGDIYLRKINSGGGSVWERDIGVGATPDVQTRPQIAEDGAGGAIVAWIDGRFHDEYLFAQRVLASGEIAWAANGVAVSRATGILASFKIVPDRRGGALIAWMDRQGGAGLQPRAQRIGSDGRAAWNATGVPICPVALDPRNLVIAPDEFGGLIAAWDDARGEWVGQVYHPVMDIETVERQGDIYAQRVTADGRIAWAAGGVAVTSLPKDQADPCITNDGAGGAIIVWSDKRDSRWLDAGDLKIPTDEKNYDIFAQRIDSAGNVLWHENGEPACGDVSGQFHPAVTAEHGSAVYVAWEDSLEATNRIYIQRIEGDYAMHRCTVAASVRRKGSWYPASDVILTGCPRGDHSDTLRIACDFHDADMAGIPFVSPSEIELIPDRGGLAFGDSANSGTPGTPENGYTVTLTRCRFSGCAGCPGGDCALGGHPSLRFTLTYRGALIGYVENVRIRSVDARGDGVVSALTNEGLGSSFGRSSIDPSYKPCYDFNGDGRVNSADLSMIAAHYGHGAPERLALTRPARSAAAAPGLKFVARRTGGSEEAGGLAVTIVLENARGISSLILALDRSSPRLAYKRWIPSANPVAVFPAATAVRDGKPLLCVAGYGLRTLDEAGIDMGTVEFAVTGADTLGNGAGIDWASELRVAFCDYVDVEGRVGSMAGVEYEETPADIPDNLLACYPNPFNPKTTIAYSIHEQGAVTLRIYAVSGRLVKILVDAVQTPRVAGYTIEWDGRNNAGASVASGVYLCRITARNFSETRKLVLLR